MTPPRRPTRLLDEPELDAVEGIDKDTLILAAEPPLTEPKPLRLFPESMAKTRHISIRLSEKDLLLIREKAAELGMPYQTLIGSILHQYVDGKIKASF
jgi:hypothetical protein